MKAVVSEEKALVRLHEAQNVRELARAVFSLIKDRIPHELLLLVLRPIEFELPLIGSKRKYQSVCDYYIKDGYRHDLWLKRSPVHPGLDVVRHSDYTPLSILKKSVFYKKILRRFGSEHGVSMVSWRGSNWLAILTVLRNKRQGDVTDDELKILLRWQVHFSSAVKRIAKLHEDKLANNSLETFIWGLPTAAVVLDWDLRILHHNAAAEELCALWRSQVKEAILKKPRSFQMPGDLLAAIEGHRSKVEAAKPNRPSSPKIIPIFTHKHRLFPELEAHISFLPAKSLSLSKGTFLINLQRREEILHRRDIYEKLRQLSRRERDVVRLASTGKRNTEIGRSLGTSYTTVRSQLTSVYEKLGIKTRYELISAFAALDELNRKGIPELGSPALTGYEERDPARLR